MIRFIYLKSFTDIYINNLVNGTKKCKYSYKFILNILQIYNNLINFYIPKVYYQIKNKLNINILIIYILF